MLYNTILTTLFATAAMAAPTQTSKRNNAISLLAVGEEWTLVDLKRTCNNADTRCVWEFDVDTNEKGPETTHCKYVIEGSPASQTPGTVRQPCGPFDVTSGWSAGDGNGFTVLSVVNYDEDKIIYGGYDDKDLPNGKTVDPDRTWPVSNLP